MAFRLEREESVVIGLKRVMKDEIDSASEHLDGRKKVTRDEAIHESRKNIKKTRALLRLMRSELGPTFRRENQKLRDIAARLSDFRDAFALIGTFDQLKKAHKAKTTGKLRSVRAALVKKRDESAKTADVDSVLTEAASALEKLSKRVKSWPLQTDGYAAIEPGLLQTYKAGRTALRLAQKEATPDHFHDLRKRVKDHWYHIRLLENIWTEMMVPYEKSLKNLETWLGDDHNLAVLRERILAEPGAFGAPEDIDLIVELIDQQQKQLRDQALALAVRIFEEKPRAMNKHINHLWDVWRHETTDLEQSPSAA